MKDIPETIYLQVGEIYDDDKDILSFHDLNEVTWSEERVFDNDIKFIRPDSLQGQLTVLEELVKTYGNRSLPNVIQQIQSIIKERAK